MAEPLRETPALALLASGGPDRPGDPGGPGRPGDKGPSLTLRDELCLVQVIARRGKERDTGRVLGLDLPARPGTVTTTGDVTVFCLRPRDWLIATPDPQGRAGGVAIEARRRLQGIAAAIDQSHGRVVLRLRGEGARDLLQHGCNIDLDPAVFGPGAMAQAGLAGIAVLLHAAPADGFDLHVARSYAPSLQRWLAHHGAVAGRDQGTETGGKA